MGETNLLRPTRRQLNIDSSHHLPPHPGPLLSPFFLAFPLFPQLFTPLFPFRFFSRLGCQLAFVIKMEPGTFSFSSSVIVFLQNRRNEVRKVGYWTEGLINRFSIFVSDAAQNGVQDSSDTM